MTRIACAFYRHGFNHAFSSHVACCWEVASIKRVRLLLAWQITPFPRLAYAIVGHLLFQAWRLPPFNLLTTAGF
jgi:hypothetical protein